MSLQSSITQVILEVGITTISELVKNIVYFILIYLGFKGITKEIRKLIKEIPEWQEKNYKNQLSLRTLDKAIEGRKL